MDLDAAQLTALGPWIYLVIWVVVALDAVLPVMPSEGAVITGAVLAVQGDASVALVLVAAVTGALAGDLGSFVLGRGVRRRRRASGGATDLPGRRGRAVRWASGQLGAHGPGTLLVCRFVPGGRTAATFTAGFVGMAPRSFAATAALGAGLWAAQSAAIGTLGGHVVGDHLALGVVLGVGLGLLVGVAVEAVRHRALARRSPPRRAGFGQASSGAPLSWPGASRAR